MKVAIKHSVSGELKEIKVGWNWLTFFLGQCLGLPFFVKGMVYWGVMFLLIVPIIDVALLFFFVIPFLLVAGYPALGIVAIVALIVGQAVWLGLNGSRLIGLHYLASGWVLQETESEKGKLVKEKWRLT